MLTSTLLLGLVLGMQHAFEADHLAAVSTLACRRQGWRAMARQGALWGSGHAIALFAISGAVLFTPWSLPDGFARGLEGVVGVLLVALGARLLHRLWRERIHVHAHRHDEGGLHLHAHSHRDDPVPHDASAHDHDHSPPSWRTLAVGLTHGAAGSAALMVLVAASLTSPAAGLAYVVLFGLGSIAGMAALSAIVAIPLTAAARRATWALRALQASIAIGTVVIGAALLLRS